MKEELDTWAARDYLCPEDLIYCEGWPGWVDAVQVYPQLFSQIDSQTGTNGVTAPKPLGIAAVAAYSALMALQCSAFAIILGSMMWFSRDGVAAVGKADGFAYVFLVVVLLLFKAIALLEAAACYGLLTLQTWAHRLTIALNRALIWILVPLVLILVSIRAWHIVVVLVPEIAVCAFIVSYLNQSEMKARF